MNLKYYDSCYLYLSNVKPVSELQKLFINIISSVIIQGKKKSLFP